MIVRERPGSFLLVKQHDHALASGVFAEHWADGPSPRESTLYAVANHDIAWRGLDQEVRWNGETGRPYSFADYPPEPKVEAYAAGLDLLEADDPYAAYLCSRHYETLVRTFGKSEAEAEFAEAETRRQERLEKDVRAEDLEQAGRNLSFLRLCDGLSLFVCLNEPGENGRPPPYPEGFEFDGTKFEAVWEDKYALGLRPEPFSGPFDVEIPYEEIDKVGRHLETGALRFRIT